MMTFDPTLPAFWDEADLKQEMFRIFDICNGCRLCDKLCPSFDVLFRRIEQEDDALTALKKNDNPVEKLTEQDYRTVSDLCYQCKLCYPKCPYVPPHEYQLDFPRLLLREQAQHTNKHGLSFRDRLLSNADSAGALGYAFPRIMNWANTNSFSRLMMEKTVGIHRDKKMPTFHGETFEMWFGKRKSIQLLKHDPIAKVVIFTTCLVKFNDPEIGKAAIRIFDHHNIETESSMEYCCGIPNLSIGDVGEAIRKADKNLSALIAFVRQGYDVVVPSPSCSLMIKQEYPLIATERAIAKEVAEHTYDLGEYIMKLHREKKLRTDFNAIPEKVLYHLPCHLKAQNIGFKSRDLLKLIPGIEVEMVQHCSGHDGQFSMKKEYYEISMNVGKKLFNKIEQSDATIVVSDCAFAHLHIEQGTARTSMHPIQLLAQAYGLSEETDG